MKILIISLLLIYQISTNPINKDRIVFPDDSDERIYSRFQKESNDPVKDEDDSDDQDDFSFLLNNTNILRSENDTEEVLLEVQKGGKSKYGKHFQGDIALMPDQVKLLNSMDFSDRTGLKSAIYRWPKDIDGKVNVPYICSDEYSPDQKTLILSAMADIEKYTCIKFLPHQDQKDYIHILSEDGCSSHLGMTGGRQVISLEIDDCVSRATILHELIHSLGFDHIQSRSDRDEFVDILWENVEKDEFSQFDKVNPKRFKNFGTPYDYYSVMHYDSKAFTKNGKRTILPKDQKYRKIIGRLPYMSEGDANRINKMYKCDFDE
ncbi:low choriolytic enzyme-like [Chironomus tepperi]|uniref:low choriolytic enzyme-like n=1 Tax=Chironomus tepperi TaxID=113505 RepID=UPI00391F50D9